MKWTTAALGVAGAGLVLLVGVWAYVTQPLVLPVKRTQPPKVDVARLETDVRKLCEAPRDYTQVATLDAIAEHVRSVFVATGATTSEQTYQVDGKVYRNVTARFGSSEGPRVIVGAHYDAYEALPGADDNASGVAGLLELARMFGAHPPKGAVELVAYTLEEPPFFRKADQGSMRHASALKQGGADVLAMFSLEMIGYFSDEPGSQTYLLSLIKPFYPSEGNYIAVVGEIGGGTLTRDIKAAMRGATDLPVYSINAPKVVQGLDWSDHRSYWLQGYPAVMITDTSFMRNKAYHTPQDTPDRLDYRRMAKVVQGVYAAVVALASG